MANIITGKILGISPVQQLPSKSGGQPFVKREMLLDATTFNPYTGERSEHENILPLEFTGERCADLDRFRPGETVDVSFALQGREWTGRDGQMRRMLSVRCYKITPHGKQLAAASPQPAPQPQAAPLDAAQANRQPAAWPPQYEPAPQPQPGINGPLPF